MCLEKQSDKCGEASVRAAERGQNGPRCTVSWSSESPNTGDQGRSSDVSDSFWKGRSQKFAGTVFSETAQCGFKRGLLGSVLMPPGGMPSGAAWTARDKLGRYTGEAASAICRRLRCAWHSSRLCYCQR